MVKLTTAEEQEFRLGHWSIDDAVEALESVEADRSDLKAELEKARRLVVQGKNEIDTAIAALETDSCWCSSKHRCYRCRALDTLRPTFERMHTYLEGSK